MGGEDDFEFFVGIVSVTNDVADLGGDGVELFVELIEDVIVVFLVQQCFENFYFVVEEPAPEGGDVFDCSWCDLCFHFFRFNREPACR